MALDKSTTAVDNLFAVVAQSPAVQSLARRLERGGALSCDGVSPAAQPFLAVLVRHLFPNRPVVVVTDGLKTQESFQQDIETWVKFEGRKPKAEAPNSQPLFYPAWEILPHEAKLPHADVISERLETLVALTQKAPLVVASVVALLQRTFSAEALRSRTRTLTRGDRIDPLDLIEWLEEQGCEPEAQVTQKGEIALRGGILDVYPLTSPWPVRLEFFGDDLESLRYFDPHTQMSREEISAITLPPGGELGILKREVERGLQTASSHEPGNASEIPSSRREPAWKRPEGRAPLATLLDHLRPETIFVLCEPERLDERADAYAMEIPDDDPFFISWEHILADLDRRGMTRLELSEVGSMAVGLWPAVAPSVSPGGSSVADAKRVEISDYEPDGKMPSSTAGGTPTATEAAGSEISAPLFASLDAFRPLGERAPEPQIAEAQRREFFSQLHRWLRQGYAVQVFCNNEGERQRFTEIWEEYGFSRAPGAGSRERQPQGQPSTLIGTLACGFIYEAGKLVVVTDAEIFGRYRVQRPRRLKSPHAVAVRSALNIDFTELEEGDYVVHLQHGIGRYLGLRAMPIGIGRKDFDATDSTRQQLHGDGQECLVIEFAPSDPSEELPKLYVPVTEAHLVGKYVGAGKARPPLNTLTGTRWAKAKAHAERAVRDVASDLLAIQAARELQPGHAFAADVPWQREFEGAFIFEETPDQMRAIVETKRDMETPKPMDRLICGDVGFGKTEVAIRAAFKAVMDGRQVAVLVPTTVLAQQHFNTFRERMADYPVRIELLSRFRTRREQQRAVNDLAAGAVDIIIGTHRLVQDDIAFKDLGLVVIDEEQRFGVLHKEKFKRLRQLVDVLTLSATPIPRTLYLALTGARDMSTIETPPQDRLPVETIVTQYDERTIRDAIQREMNRGGQVFFLHNRVMTIDTMAQKLRILVPQARMVVGHGQMHNDDLEEVMTSFVNGEADVLLSTTIIESGLDIPNANTIIIDRADRFGLSDLYQLRGRVGRYKHQAYAYLLIPRHAGLLSDARKRITALKQYSTLGSGFKIAMRDLEIRGAGNLLGSEQSGHITAVGFELYCQLLKQSVSALKGEQVKPRIEVQVKLDFLALNPGEEISAKSKVPSREVEAHSDFGFQPSGSGTRLRAPAFIPLKYISDARQRIEVYRKLAQATDKPALEALEKELRDRFGPLLPPVELLLATTELKSLASERAVTVIEVKEDKLMLTRNNDFITLGGKFPRLKKKEARARLKEIKKLLLAL